jgi:DNA-directed RNA polymerase II subunit RPB2
MYGGDEEEYDEEDEEITQEDAWAVISAYFEEKGLVRQQLDSFDEFIQNTMQEIVDESADIEIRPESQHNPGRNTETGDVSYFLLLFFFIIIFFFFAQELCSLLPLSGGRW